MELRQIEFFLQLYKDRNVTVASQNLYISQQGMSKSIANLEKEIGFPLFKRSVSDCRYILSPIGKYSARSGWLPQGCHSDRRGISLLRELLLLFSLSRELPVY